MKKLIAGMLMVAAALIAPSAAQAHEIQTHHYCNFWFVNCNATLTDGEAAGATVGVLDFSNDFTPGYPPKVFRRVNSSAAWVRHIGAGQAQKKYQHVCLIDVDRTSDPGSGGFIIEATCHYGDWPGPF